VDHVQLPQRAGAVERAREDPRHGLGELAVAARRRHGGLADVEVEVEVGILDPVGVVEAERNADQPPAERRQQVDAPRHQPADVRDRQLAARCGRRVVDGEPAHVPVGPGGLHRQELGVQAGQLSHGLSSSRIAFVLTVPAALLGRTLELASSAR
jgi:hypothetical protein